MAQVAAFRQGSQFPASALYFWLRAAAKINDAFHLYHPDRYTGVITPGSVVGISIAGLLPVLLAASVLYILLRMADGLVFQRLLLNRLGGIVALLVPPSFELMRSSRPYHAPPLWFFWGELALFILILLFRSELLKWPAWILVLMAAVHAVVWGVFLFDSAYMIYGRFYAVLFAPVVSLLGVVAWILYLRSPAPAHASEAASQKTPWLAWLLAAATMSANLLLFVPWPGPKLTAVKDPNTIEIAMARTNCMGPCPVYEIKVKGDGSVEYDGEESVKECGKRAASISAKDVHAIFEAFDQANFFALEPRAFLQAFDVPGVNVKISTASRSKTVFSTVYFRDSGSHQQSDFERAADRIDEIVGTGKWVGEREMRYSCRQWRK